MKVTRQITGIVIHCSATPNGRWHDMFNIDQWHRDRGFSRAVEFRERFNPRLFAVGYHFVIYTNGAIATGRHLDEVGAHAQGFNSKTIGVCLVGTNRFSHAQWLSLRDNVSALVRNYSNVKIHGHRDLPNVHKECPGFNVKDWLESGMQPQPGYPGATT